MVILNAGVCRMVLLRGILAFKFDHLILEDFETFNDVGLIDIDPHDLIGNVCLGLTAIPYITHEFVSPELA